MALVLEKEGTESPEERKERLLEENKGLVYKIASQFWHRGCGLEFNDLLQEGRIAVIEADKDFNPERGTKFSTFASYRIRQRIQRAIEKNSSLICPPSNLLHHGAEIKRTIKELYLELGRQPSPSEIAKVTGKPLPVIKRFLCLSQIQVISLDKENEEGESFWDEILSDNSLPSLEEQAISSCNSERLKEILKSILDPQEYLVITLRFGLDGNGTKSVNEVGKSFSLTRQRISQIEHQALRKIRNKANQEEGLKAFLLGFLTD